MTFQVFVQGLACICFLILAVLDFKNQCWDFAGLNLAIFFLYVFLYFQPFAKLIGKYNG